MDLEAQEYDKYSNYRRVKVDTLSILVKNPSDNLIPLLEGVPDGTLPLLIETDGVKFKLRDISNSLVVLHDIVKITPFYLRKDGEETLIQCMTDLIEGEIKWT